MVNISKPIIGILGVPLHDDEKNNVIALFSDYSLGMITLQLIALISWSIYIFTSQQSTIVYIGTIIDLILLLLIDFLILKYYKFNKQSIK